MKTRLVLGKPSHLSRLKVGEIVNLRRVRKSVVRREAEAQAAENRVKFGRTKAEKATADAERKAQAHRLDGHVLTKRETT
ncbi:MAG: DUF4169 family protein [Pseudomonadota bacterium]